MKLKHYLSIFAIAAIIASCSKGSTGPQGEQGPIGPIGKVNDTTEAFSVSASGSTSGGLTWTYNGSGGYFYVNLPTITGVDPTKGAVTILLSVDGGNNWNGLPYIGTTSGTGTITDVDIDYSVSSTQGIEILYLPQTGAGNLSSAPAALIRATYQM